MIEVPRRPTEAWMPRHVLMRLSALRWRVVTVAALVDPSGLHPGFQPATLRLAAQELERVEGEAMVSADAVWWSTWGEIVKGRRGKDWKWKEGGE